VSFLLDTNVVSEWARPRPEPAVVAWLADVDEDRVFLSVITLAELQLGIESLPAGPKRARLLAWFDDDLLPRFESRVIGVTPAVARDWGTVSALAQRAGKPIGAMDAFVAATARVHGLALVTRNDADFRAVGIELLNPWSS
jgi:predicted nucleic acid-binding protein